MSLADAPSPTQEGTPHVLLAGFPGSVFSPGLHFFLLLLAEEMISENAVPGNEKMKTAKRKLAYVWGLHLLRIP